MSESMRAALTALLALSSAEQNALFSLMGGENAAPAAPTTPENVLNMCPEERDDMRTAPNMRMALAMLAMANPGAEIRLKDIMAACQISHPIWSNGGSLGSFLAATATEMRECGPFHPRERSPFMRVSPGVYKSRY